MNLISKTFLDVKKSLKKNSSGFKEISVAVLADSASQHFTMALKGMGLEHGVRFNVFEAEYDQIELQVNDPGSDLYSSKSEFIILFFSVRKLYKKYANFPVENRENFAYAYISNMRHLVNTIGKTTSSKIILLNFPEINDGVFGNFSSKLTASWIYQLRSINLEFMRLSGEFPDLFLIDVAILATRFGEAYVQDPKLYVFGDIIFHLDFLPELAKNITDVILAVSGRFKKCLILDLDNTIWGGVIGDDGIEGIQLGDLGNGKAFMQLQTWAKELKKRGIILTVCSKNTEKIAREPFEIHPDMVLRAEDIAVFVANWENKVDNIKMIQSILNIGFDSMVFLDDNPFERNLVRENLPEIYVPELPEDPAEYLNYLVNLNLFETGSFSNEDAGRTKQYQVEAERMVLAKTFASEADYLIDLNMIGTVKSFEKFTIPRVAQLTQRSNQFNLRTVRYTEEDIQRISNSNEYVSFSISLADKFGDYGLIAVIILKIVRDSFFIDTWLMSCRVLKRSMENFTLDCIVEMACEKGINKICGEYLPTSKNEIVKDHYALLGFTKQNEHTWTLNLTDYNKKPFYIQKK